MGGDWNCVPDVCLDVHVDSANPLRYHAQNQGADVLEGILSNLGLSDERRDQLGTEAEYTHKQKRDPREGRGSPARDWIGGILR